MPFKYQKKQTNKQKKNAKVFLRKGLRRIVIKNIPIKYRFNPVKDGPFPGCSRMGGKKASLPKICPTYPTIMKVGTVIPY